jgi:hypothetical protein
MIFPEKFTAGETVEATVNSTDYPATDWTMSVAVVSMTGNTGLDEDATADGSDHVFSIDTSSLVAGRYAYQAKVTDGTDTHFVEQGEFVVEANLFSQIGDTAITSLDTRSHAQKMLDAIEAVLEGRATREHLEMTHNGRTLKRHSFDQLTRIRDYYRGELARANVRKRGTFKNIGVRI